MSIVSQSRTIPGAKYKAVLSNRIYLSKAPGLHEKLVEELTYTLPPKKPGGHPESHCDVTRVNNNVLTIPSGRIDLIPDDFDIIDNRTVNEVRFPKFKLELREDQLEVYDEVHDSCIINANPSWGKTFTGVAIATKLKQKTLIIVDKVFLREQWEGEVKKCLGIKPGVVGSKKNNIKPDIVVSNVQSLKNNIDKMKNEFGTIIVDECHHLPADIFKNVVDKFNARYKIGLSATLWRKDGKHIMLTDFLGTEVYTPPDRNALKPIVTIVDTDVELSGNSNEAWGIRINKLVDNPSYMELVLNLCQVQADRGHKVLAVADRVEFLEQCSEILENFKLITGITKDRTLDFEEYDGILGSIKIFAEGINMPPLSSLILGVPINNRALLEQLIGRICRPYEGKKQPEIIDIALKGHTGRNQLASRINFYMEKGYEIRRI